MGTIMQLWRKGNRNLERELQEESLCCARRNFSQIQFLYATLPAIKLDRPERRTGWVGDSSEMRKMNFSNFFGASTKRGKVCKMRWDKKFPACGKMWAWARDGSPCFGQNMGPKFHKMQEKMNRHALEWHIVFEAEMVLDSHSVKVLSLGNLERSMKWEQFLNKS